METLFFSSLCFPKNRASFPIQISSLGLSKMGQEIHNTTISSSKNVGVEGCYNIRGGSLNLEDGSTHFSYLLLKYRLGSTSTS